MNKVIFEDEKWKAYVTDICNWKEIRKKRYQVKLQKALPDKEYNVPGRPGIVYNILENCEEIIAEGHYIVTGLLGKMWIISEEYLDGYEVEKEEIGEEPKVFYAKTSDKIYYGLHIPINVSFAVEIPEYGTLKGNSDLDSIPHGAGDYLVCNSFNKGDYRIVSGAVFHRMYG